MNEKVVTFNVEYEIVLYAPVFNAWWGPLCCFLGLPQPSTPFPRSNSGEQVSISHFSLFYFPYMKTGPLHLIHPHPRMTEWHRNDKNGSFRVIRREILRDGRVFHPCHSDLISSFRGHSDLEWPSNDGKSHPNIIPVTLPNLTFGCTTFLQTLWQGHKGLLEWCRNDMEWNGMT